MNESTWQSLAHARWECKYQVVVIAKYRRTAMSGEIRASLGGSFDELARQKECRSVAGHLLADPVHLWIELPPMLPEITPAAFPFPSKVQMPASAYGRAAPSLRTAPWAWNI